MEKVGKENLIDREVFVSSVAEREREEKKKKK